MADLAPGDHLCCLYDTDEERHALLKSFIREGLERRERVLCILDPNTAHDVLGHLQADGVDVVGRLENEQLSLLGADDVRGASGPEQLIAILRAEVQRSLLHGQSALRVAVEMHGVLRGSQDVIAYECRLNEFLHESGCLALCQYDRRVAEPSVLFHALVTHPTAVVGADVCENLYYLPTTDLPGQNLSPSGLHVWLDNLVARNRTEEALLLAKYFSDNVIETANVMIVSLDPLGNILALNEAAERVTGYAKEELAGQNWFDVMAPRARYPGLWESFSAAMAEGLVPKTCEGRIVTKTGEERCISWRHCELREQDRISRVVSFGVDVTQRKQAEDLFETLSGSSPTSIYIIQAGKFQFVNPQLQKHSGYSEEELLNTIARDLVLAEDRAAVRRNARSMLMGERSSPYECRVVTKAGEVRWIMETVAPISYRGRPAVLANSLDITEHKRAQEQLKESYERLQQTIEKTIHAMALTAELRDPYTAGHQRRVAELACAIARELGLPEERLRVIRLAGIIHDLGKINVPAEILSKPGRISDIEFSLIKAHPQVGHDILKTIELPWPIAKIVLQHHEAFDGSGYPAGLAGEDILLEARILGVADVIEAMSSHRPYRPALGVERALEEVSQNRNVLFDRAVVDACMELFTRKGFRLE